VIVFRSVGCFLFYHTCTSRHLPAITPHERHKRDPEREREKEREEEREYERRREKFVLSSRFFLNRDVKF
jgi:hypothetical protein